MAVIGGTEHRAFLLREVAQILDSVEDGCLRGTKETQAIDFKEEAGRRQGRELLPGRPENPDAATKLADEVACMANSPGGGALIVGVEDGTGRLLGTELSIDWLRQEINSRVGVAPDISARQVEGFRLLVILVSQAPAPVEDTSDRLRWRVGDSCQPVDRSEWWQHRASMQSFDLTAIASERTAADARPEALSILRKWRQAEPWEQTDEELLRSLGALRSDGRLSAAAAMLVTSLGTVGLELTQFDVPSGSVRNRVAPVPEQSLAEQIYQVETALDVLNSQVTVEHGFSHVPIRQLPRSAVREAVLNGVIHRDWNRSGPTEVRWTDSDAMLEVHSPGGFVGHVNASNILTQREARYPALADLFRATGLVDKQGVGIDRMYRAMIALGHNPPQIEEVSGVSVEVTLRGGMPSTPVLEVMNALRPAERKEDYRLSILLYHLLYHPFITPSQLAEQLQASVESAQAALDVAKQTLVDATPIVAKYNDVWVLGETTVDRIERHRNEDPVRELLPYRTTDPLEATRTVERWLSVHEAITTGDFMRLTGVARGTSKRLLDGIADRGDIVPKGQGRASRFEQV
ncbi:MULTISPECIES: DUF5635 domain-containing protein [Corynebacterium]|nr:DUF5635 domain-containing protein [Corynebacterium hadale]WKC61035.1 Divergent AAA domain protein [Corynebacterium hadale]